MDVSRNKEERRTSEQSNDSKVYYLDQDNEKKLANYDSFSGELQPTQYLSG